MHPKIDAFLEMLTVERAAARNTLLSYTADLDDFAAFAAGRGFDVAQADSATCQAYMASLHARGLSARTAARRRSALRQFHLFLLQEGARNDDPTAELDAPRLPQPLPKLLSEAEIEALLTAAAAKPGRGGLAALAGLELLYATGMRISEMLALPRSALGLRPGVAKSPLDPGILHQPLDAMIIRGKGGKERLLPLSHAANRAVTELLAVDRESRWLFPGRDPERPLTRQAFFLLLKQIACEAGLEAQRVSPHVLRHSFASHMLARGADLRSLQALLGHADIATVQIYTHTQMERLRRLVEASHPLAVSERPADTGNPRDAND